MSPGAFLSFSGRCFRCPFGYTLVLDTLCLYHGEEKWDGPRSLKDMMDFGADGKRQKWEDYFADYPMRIVCADEFVDCGGFRTSLGELFALLPFRKDKAGLEKLLEENPAYQSMDEETARTVSILMGIRKFMEQEEKYRNGEDYNMCQAIREMLEDSRKEGWGEGRKEGKREGRREGKREGRKEGRRKEQAEGIRIFIQSNRDDGITDEAIAENLQKYYFLSKDRARKALKKRDRKSVV